MYLPVETDPLEAKQLFAAALLRWPKDPWRAAQEVFPTDTRAALFIMQAWPHDGYVKASQQALIKEFGREHFLPSMEETAHEVFHLATVAHTVEDKLKSFELYAKMRGFIAKPADNANVNVNVSNKVLVIKEYAESTIIDSQAKLLAEMAEDAE